MEPLLSMIADRFNSYRIILASRSPRRQQLLKETGLKFDVVTKDYDESYPSGLSGKEIAEYISRCKAMLFLGELSDNEIVITADTIVWCDNKVMSKPVDFDDALNILRELSGNTHEVITGVTILSPSQEKTFSVTTRVTFDALSEEELKYYITEFRPYDKAGAYGIQEWIGLVACSTIEGSYFNVVGLPVRTLYRELLEFVG